MAIEPTDQKNLSADPIERMAEAHFNNGPSPRPWRDLDRETKLDCCRDMIAAVKALMAHFEEIGACFATEHHMAFLCSAVTSGLRTQVLEPPEQRETNDRTG